MVERSALESLTNGILDKHDNFIRDGVPPSKFSLSSSVSLSDILASSSHIDPFKIAQADVARVSEGLHVAVGSDHPIIRQVAAHFFENTGKFTRPVVVCLMAQALAADAGTIGTTAEPVPSEKQLSLAMLTELIHTATLLHDDVIDESATRRGVASVHSVYGNKLAILGGDYLLSRASVSLARLRNCDVTELMSMTIEHLVKGEVMQLKGQGGVADEPGLGIQSYVTKSYYKTASLLDQSCKSCALLGSGYDRPEHVHIASGFGKNVGIAFQIIDDILDFEGQAAVTGKPALNDIKQGIATLPVLLAADTHPHLNVLIQRKFKQDGDIERALEYMESSGGLERSRTIAEEYAAKAVASLLELKESTARTALISLVDRVLHRNK